MAQLGNVVIVIVGRLIPTRVFALLKTDVSMGELEDDSQIVEGRSAMNKTELRLCVKCGVREDATLPNSLCCKRGFDHHDFQAKVEHDEAVPQWALELAEQICAHPSGDNYLAEIAKLIAAHCPAPVQPDKQHLKAWAKRIADGIVWPNLPPLEHGKAITFLESELTSFLEAASLPQAPPTLKQEIDDLRTLVTPEMKQRIDDYREGLEPALPDSWQALPVGTWFFMDSPTCINRYSVQERTDRGSIIVCSTPYVHEQAKLQMQEIAEMHNRNSSPALPAEGPDFYKQKLTEECLRSRRKDEQIKALEDKLARAKRSGSQG